MKRIFSFLFVLFLLVSTLAACEQSGALTYVTTAPESTMDAGIIPETSVEVIERATNDVETTAVSVTAVTEAAATEIKTVSVSWQFGYIGSSSNSSYAYVINNKGTYYSYTDVITLENAGTAIWFTDNNENSNGNLNFASSAAFVLSSWKKSGSSWVIDKEGINIAGSGSTNSLIATNLNGEMVYYYVTSFDNENIRLCYRSGQSSSFTPFGYPTIYYAKTSEEGTAAALEEDERDYESWMTASKISSYYKSLEGITMNVLGDSYFAGDVLETKYVWCSLLADKYGMTYANKGKNGSAMSDCEISSSPMVYRYTELPANSADIILLEGGKNDFNNNVPIGTNNDITTKTFKGALNFLIEKLKEKYPGALIICVTVWNTTGTNSLGLTVSDYGRAMIDVSAAQGIQCFNSMNTSISGVDMTSTTFRNQYCQTSSDVSHLNIAGHRMVLPKFEKFIAEQYEAHLATKK